MKRLYEAGSWLAAGDVVDDLDGVGGADVVCAGSLAVDEDEFNLMAPKRKGCIDLADVILTPVLKTARLVIGNMDMISVRTLAELDRGGLVFL